MKQELQCFKTGGFHSVLWTFFNNLTVPLNYISEEPAKPQDILSSIYKKNYPAFQLLAETRDILKRIMNPASHSLLVPFV